MKRRLATGYTFDASAKTIVHADFSDIGLDGIQLITNVADNVVIYQFNSPSKGGSLATDTLTLTHDTTSMSDTDELMILVEDGVTTLPVDVTNQNTQYDDGQSTAANPTGTMPIFDNGGTWSKVSTSDGLPVAQVGDINIGAVNSDVPVISGGTPLDVNLPTGAATSAKQDTGNTSLASIDGKITAVNTGAVVVASGNITANAGTNLNTSALLTTAAHDAAFGTAGSADSQVRSIQGIASMTPVQVSQATAANLNMTEASAATIATNTGNAATSLGVMDDWDNGASDGASVSGDVAHDAADAGEPVKIGGKALDLGATPTAVTANDRVNGAFLRNGVQLVLGGDPNIVSKNLNVSDADGAQTDAAIVTVSAGTAIVVTKVSVMVDSATTATGGVAVRIGFGTANVPAVDSNGIILAHPGIAAGSGVVEGNGSGIIGIGASNEDLRVTCEDPTGGAIDIIVTYFTVAIG